MQERASTRSEAPSSNSNGSTIYAARSPEEVIDLLQKGQGVFGIAVRPVHDEVAGEIHRLFPDHITSEVVEAPDIAKATGN
jgi:hypothetical protein